MTGQKVVARRNRKAITIARTRIVGEIEVLPSSRVAFQFTQHIVEIPKWAIRLIAVLVLLIITAIGLPIGYETIDTADRSLVDVSD